MNVKLSVNRNLCEISFRWIRSSVKLVLGPRIGISMKSMWDHFNWLLTVTNFKPAARWSGTGQVLARLSSLWRCCSWCCKFDRQRQDPWNQKGEEVFPWCTPREGSWQFQEKPDPVWTPSKNRKISILLYLRMPLKYFGIKIMYLKQEEEKKPENRKLYSL